MWQRALKYMGSRAALSTPYHPQTDGQTERSIQTLLRLIRTYASKHQNEWEEILPYLQFSLNDSYCEATKSTPFRVLFGCDPIAPTRLVSRQATSFPLQEETLEPVDWEERTAERVGKAWEFIREHQKQVAQRMKERYDRHRKELKLQSGDLVMVSTKTYSAFEGQRKQGLRYTGPYVVQTKINDNAYRIIGLPPGVPATQNVQYLIAFRPSPKKFRARPTPQANVPRHHRRRTALGSRGNYR